MTDQEDHFKLANFLNDVHFKLLNMLGMHLVQANISKK